MPAFLTATNPEATVARPAYADARQIWERFPGRWEVRVMDRNRNAREFWMHAVSRFLGTAVESVAFEKDGEAWRVFSFKSEPRPSDASST